MSYLILGFQATSLAVSLVALFVAKRSERRASLWYASEWNRAFPVGMTVSRKKGAVRTRTVSNAYMRRGKAVVDLMDGDAVPLLELDPNA